jgi:hypothetical protein
MSLPLIVLDCAVADLQQAIDQYDRRAPGLGESLYWQVEETIDFIEANPHSYQIDFGTFHRAPTHRFPFCVYYRVLPKVIEVVAILDCRRNPLTIRSQVRSRH